MQPSIIAPIKEPLKRNPIERNKTGAQKATMLIPVNCWNCCCHHKVWTILSLEYGLVRLLSGGFGCFMVVDQIVELGFGVRVHATDLVEGLPGFLKLTPLDEAAGCVWNEECTHCHDDGRNSGTAERKSPPVFAHLRRKPVYYCCKQYPSAEEGLEGCGKCASPFWWCHLCYVYWGSLCKYKLLFHFFHKIIQKVVYKPIPLLIIHFPKRKSFYSRTNSWSIIHDTLNSLILKIKKKKTLYQPNLT